jgi:hypothetical protein
MIRAMQHPLRPVPVPHLLLAALAAAACAERDDPPVGPNPVFEPGSPGFFDTPWPSDLRRDKDPDGDTISVEAFPNPLGITLIDDYLLRADALDGFGTSSPVYVGFDGPLDPALMPTPAGSRETGSAVVLVDVDPRSPYRGERFPVQWEQFAYPDSAYAPEHLLAVAPVFGWPLRPATRYALIVTTGAARRSAAWAERPVDPALEETLPLVGVDLEDIAVATVFTTQDPVGELAGMAWSVQNELGAPDLDQVLEHLFDHSTYTSWRTHYRSPVFTQGEPPYQTQGGSFEFDSEGRAKIARWDDMRLAVCTPVGVEAPPEGWPVVIYQHGTGGAYRGFCDSEGAFEVAKRLGAVGVIGLGIDQPLHGNRPGADAASDLTHFNILNPDGARTNFRQGALDAIYLARALARKPATFSTPDGQRFVTDPDRVMFYGHSQGGLTGALAAPFFAGDVQAAVLSGAGGVLAITVVTRKDIIDFEELVRQLLGIPAEEPLSPLHPTLGLVQTLVEVTDPVNYAPYWHSQPGTWVNHQPTPVLLTSGTLDSATPYPTAVALAAAGRLPLIGEPATRAEAVRMRIGEPMALPRFDTVRTFTGSWQTSGFAQFYGGTHFVVFEEQAASDLTTNWIESTAAGGPLFWY